ncbi:hypothetical protein [uncultured Sulfitobacter sp.]|uniref:hypothetical protein n=1 Tax=uncultured Sulfitobacter sp. TaxID=191468 RepID=UPI002614F085|nr:hypothetical protein [uncultured Sulfitobacter sp.]
MTQKMPDGAATPKSVIVRQLIVSMAALCIMGLGAWSLMGQQAPYHPEIFEEEVSRTEGSDLIRIAD